MNGANGMSDMEGKAATGSGERGGSRASFKHRCGNDLGFGNAIPCQSVFIRGFSKFVKRA
jgi:hypothetical protein